MTLFPKTCLPVFGSLFSCVQRNYQWDKYINKHLLIITSQNKSRTSLQKSSLRWRERARIQKLGRPTWHRKRVKPEPGLGWRQNLRKWCSNLHHHYHHHQIVENYLLWLMGTELIGFWPKIVIILGVITKYTKLYIIFLN